MRELKEAFKFMVLWLQQKYYQGFQPSRTPSSWPDHIDSVVEVMGNYELGVEYTMLEENDDNATISSQD